MKTWLYWLVLISIVCLFVGCTQDGLQGDASRGAELVRSDCEVCRNFPKPERLPKSYWEQEVLPQMGRMLGIFADDSERIAFETEKGMDQPFPDTPLISLESWLDIQAYYLENAPEALSLPANQAIIQELSLFSVETPEKQIPSPSTTMIKIRDQLGGLFLGDALSQSMYIFDQDLKLDKTAKTQEGAVQVHEFANSFVITVMGSFEANDDQSGVLFALPKQNESPAQLFIDSLRRPVHSAIADFNQDKEVDFVIAENGKRLGQLAYWSMDDQRVFQPTVIKEQVGAVRSVVYDLNGDGLDDVLTLFNRRVEEILVFYQQTDGSFLEEPLLSFEPWYGSSYFELVDIDTDGDMDIVYTNGDPSSFPAVLRPDHGIHYFINDGQNNFEEDFFYPMYGASKAIPGDFDGDGDVDIAAISYYPDFELQANRGFLFLENQGNGEYLTRTFPESNRGRWLHMDAGDIDQDGDLDIVLGSHVSDKGATEELLEIWEQANIPFLVLKNNTLSTTIQ